LSIKFFTTASGPTNIIIGQPYPITLCMKLGATDEKALPKIVLKGYEATLTAHANLQFPTNYWLEKEHVIVLSKQSMDLEMVPDQGIELQGIFDETKAWIEPTFTSWALSRTYLMNVYLTVEVVGKRFRLMLRWPGVVLHSCRLDGMVEAKALQEQQSPPAYMPGGR
jgi:hypothetical protein